MSSSVGYVLQPGGAVIGYFEWSNTSDVAVTWVYQTYEELEEQWKRHRHERDHHRSGTCAGTELMTVTLRVDAREWPGKVCPVCWTIVEGADPYGAKEEWP